LITGGSRGLGAALAKELARQGARLVLVARGAEALGEVAGAIRAAGGEAHALAADVGAKDEVYAIAGAAASLVGEVDLVVLAGKGTTELRLGPGTRRRVVDGILTGVHDVATSHFALLESFAPRRLLDRAHVFAEAHGYRSHEFGDAILVLAAPAAPASPADPGRGPRLGETL
jgi:NAD(P)-dependent dehydrogenase (short-subunit alcohol dehydrogenase family)